MDTVAREVMIALPLQMEMEGDEEGELETKAASEEKKIEGEGL